MARQRVNIPASLPEFLDEEPSISVKRRLRIQTERQLSREEAALRAEYDRVISSASGPISPDWTERWNALIARRERLSDRAYGQIERAQTTNYVTPSMVMAPGQQMPSDSYIQGDRYPINFHALREPRPAQSLRAGQAVRVNAQGQVEAAPPGEATGLIITGRGPEDSEYLVTVSPVPESERSRIRGIRADQVVLDETDGQITPESWDLLRQRQSAESAPVENQRFYQEFLQAPAPREREAANLISEFVRNTIREEGFARQIMPPRPVSEDVDVTLALRDDGSVEVRSGEGITIERDGSTLRMINNQPQSLGVAVRRELELGASIGNVRGPAVADSASDDPPVSMSCTVPPKTKRKQVIVWNQDGV